VSDLTLEAVLAKVRESATAQIEGAREHAKRVTAAADAYARAVESDLAHRLAAQLGQAPAGKLAAEDAALALAEVVYSLPEFASRGEPAAAPSIPTPAARPVVLVRAPAITGDDSPTRIGAATDAPPVLVPTLRQVCVDAPLVMVGGIVVPEKLKWLRRCVPGAEWIETTRGGGPRTIDSIIARMHGRRIGALVLLHGLIGRSHGDQLINAARASGTPFSYADKAGTGSLMVALAALETHLTRRAKEAR
jgi:hypothetical protein